MLHARAEGDRRRAREAHGPFVIHGGIIRHGSPHRSGRTRRSGRRVGRDHRTSSPTSGFTPPRQGRPPALRSLQGPNHRQQLLSRPPGGGCAPTDQRRTPAEEHEDPAVARLAGLETAIHPPPPGAARHQRRRRHFDAACAHAPQSRRLRLAHGIGLVATRQYFSRQVGARKRRGTEVNGPQGASDGRQVVRVGEPLMAQELRPCAVRRIAEIVRRTVARRVPPCSRLTRTFPQERTARVGVAKSDHGHVAGDAARALARPRTCRGPGSSGRHPNFRMSRGARFPRTVRGRANQRRMPVSL